MFIFQILNSQKTVLPFQAIQNKARNKGILSLKEQGKY